MKDGVSIRRAAADEAVEIAAVLRIAFAEFEPLYTAAGFAATTPTPAQLRQRWSEGPVWLAVHAGRIVGTVAAVPKIDGVYLRSMALLPDARGLGLGVTLLDQVVEYARHVGARRIFLSTTPFLDRAIRLYERFGFERRMDGPHTLHGTPLLTMEKRLP